MSIDMTRIAEEKAKKLESMKHTGITVDAEFLCVNRNLDGSIDSVSVDIEDVGCHDVSIHWVNIPSG